MVDNYQDIKDFFYANKLRHRKLLVTLWYRKEDKNIDKNDRACQFLIDGLEFLNYENIKKDCIENGFRCYITMIDTCTKRWFDIAQSSARKLKKRYETQFCPSVGWHTIDLDHIEKEEEIVNWLVNHGVDKKNIGIFNSLHNKTILFKSAIALCNEYMESEYDELNQVHYFPIMTLYAKDN